MGVHYDEYSGIFMMNVFITSDWYSCAVMKTEIRIKFFQV